MKKKRSVRYLSPAVFALLVLFGGMVKGQSTVNYTFSTAATASLTNMTGSTQLVDPSTNDGASSATNIGFDFWFMGTRYTQFSASSNGAIELGGTAISSTFYGANFPEATTPIIAPYLGDLITSSSGKV